MLSSRHLTKIDLLDDDVKKAETQFKIERNKYKCVISDLNLMVNYLKILNQKTKRQIEWTKNNLK